MRIEDDIRHLTGAQQKSDEPQSAVSQPPDPLIEEDPAEVARRELEDFKLLERFFSLALDMICIAGVDGRLQRLNPAFEQTLGFSDDEMLGFSLLDFVHADDLERTTSELAKLAAGDITVSLENRMRCRDGSYKWLAWNATLVPETQLIYAIARDITENKQTAAREKRLVEILEATPDLVAIGDPDGKVLYLNSSGRLRLGIGLMQDISRRSLSDFYPPWAARKVLDEAFPAALEDGVWTGETAFLNSEGIEIPFSQLFLVHRSDTSDEVRFISTIARDITEAKRHEAELSAARDTAVAASRLKSQFLANMSHELRTPLNAIIGFSELILDGIPGPLTEEQVQCMNDVLESGRHLLSLISDILDLSKIEAGRMELFPEDFDAAMLINAAFSVVSPQASKKQITLRETVPPGEMIVRADLAKARQVLINLLANAIKFTGHGGWVEVTAHPAPRMHGAIEIVVEDNGIGISAEDLSIIFDEFRQVDGSHARQHEGTGLGLSLCRKFLRLMGGDIWVQSAPDEGSKFAFTLPAAPKEDERPPHVIG